MPLSRGTLLGGYEIAALVGAGGMGEVYDARDRRLDRRVALKVLPEALASDSDRLLRFEREAKLLASFNHPHIASLYALERIDGRHVLVMEFIDGEDLTTRLGRGRLALEEALTIAHQIADALDAAHEKGIVHRDLKPANIKITPDGMVKVLDFGLAKEIASPEQMSALPTALGHTQLGVVVGTAAYMAPEQAQGKGVDKRSDIWSFGVVLLEMLTGTSPFLADSFAGTLAAVLTRELNLDEVPPAVRPLVRQCLQRNPRDRLRDIGDAALLLESVVGLTPAHNGSRSRVSLALGAVSLTLAAALIWTAARPATPMEMNSRRFVLDTELANPGTGFALSPDGMRLAYAQAGDADQRLWVRDLDQPSAKPIVGTEGGKRPVFSPDGQWFAFFTGQARLGHLKKVPVSGNAFNTRGSATTLCDDAHLYGASWTGGGDLFFTGPSGLMRVKAAGGSCEAVSHNDAEGDHRWPQVLPDGTHVLFSIGREGAFDSARIAVLDLQNGTHRVVLDGGANARYVPSGHLVFARAGQLFAVAFDLNRLEARGSPRVVVDSIFHVNAGGFAAYSFDRDGTLLYTTPEVDGFEWRDRSGRIQATSAPPGHYRYFRLSPDATRVALQQSGRGDVEVIQLDRGTAQPVTSENMNHTPIWTPDGRAVTFSTLGKGIFHRVMAGSTASAASPLIETSDEVAPWDWSADARTLFYEEGDPSSIWMLSVDNGVPGERRRLLGEPKTVYQHPVISPDGRWLAYTSYESGARQVSIRAYPGLGEPTQVSIDGGSYPRWSRNGRELFFLSGRNEVMVSGIAEASGRLTATRPQRLFQGDGAFDVDPSGQRFLVVVKKKPEQIELVTNWFTDVRRRFTAK